MVSDVVSLGWCDSAPSRGVAETAVAVAPLVTRLAALAVAAFGEDGADGNSEATLAAAGPRAAWASVSINHDRLAAPVPRACLRLRSDPLSL